MLTRWSPFYSDFDDLFSTLANWQREQAWPDAFSGLPSQFRTNLSDDGHTYTLRTEVPGFAEKELDIAVTADTVTIKGTREPAHPEGYTAHRQERGKLTFTRSFSLPQRVNTEKTHATLSNGVLTLTLEKSEDVKPRQISVRSV